MLFIRTTLIFLSLVLGLLSCEQTVAAEVPPAAKQKVNFQRHIQPILRKHCLRCHGPKKQEGNLRVDLRQSLLKGGDSEKPAIKPGNGLQSRLIRLVAGVDPDQVMPPEGKRLSAEQVGLLRAWIDQGAKGLDANTKQSRTTTHWSFQPIGRPSIPPTSNRSSRSPIDAFIMQQLKKHQLSMSPPASRDRLIRRLYLDLLGLLPTPQQVREFTRDKSLNAYEQLVDRVLASPRYGERWARHWLDVVRFAETNGFETNTPRPNAYHYRDYVINAFNNDRPYDRFLTDQIAGDSSGTPVATGFLVAGAYDRVKSPDIKLTLTQRQDELADMINATSTAFLAMTVACARCHNHKFDPILQTDFYGMQAVFAGVQHGSRQLPVAVSEEAAKARISLQRELRQQQQVVDKIQLQLASSTALGVDDEPRDRRFQINKTGGGRVPYPKGSRPGQRNDVGGKGRLPMLGDGQYTVWTATKPGEILAQFRPQRFGHSRIWLSWGCYPSHSPQVEYVLDRDGDVATTQDQKVIARVDQSRWVGKQEQAKNQPSWSGLFDAGVHETTQTCCLFIRTTDRKPAGVEVVVFQPVGAGTSHEKSLPSIAEPIRSDVNEERFPPIKAKRLRFTVLATNSAEPCMDELEVFAAKSNRNVALQKPGVKLRSSGDFPNNAFHKLKHINDGKHGNSHSWISNQTGRGWVEIEFSQQEAIDRVRWGRDKQKRYTDRTATRYLIEVADQQGKWTTVGSSANHLGRGLTPAAITQARLNALPASKAAKAQKELDHFAQLERRLKDLGGTTLVAYAGRFAQPGPTHRLHRGDPLQKREIVQPTAISILGTLQLDPKADEAKRRQALAKWMIRRDNPLTARVIVNRLWQHHFGVGLVRTPSDFGANGGKPTHPELLDWLAMDLMDHDWSLKRIQRQIVLSATYRQSSAPRKEPLAVDAGSRFLWRFPPRRLEAEVIRDNILMVTGSLDLRMHGPGYSVFKPNSNYVRVYIPKDNWGPAEWRRMIYMTKVRMERDDVFGTFDCPDAGQPTSRRSRSTTAIQALNLLNSQFMIQQANRFASRLHRECGNDQSSQIHRAFSLCFGRQPDQVELKAALVLVRRQGVAALCRALLNSNELLFLP